MITNHLKSGRSTRCVKCQNRGRRRIAQEKVIEAARRFKNNESLTSIAADLQCSRSSLADHVSQYVEITLGFWTKPIGRRAAKIALEKGFSRAFRRYRKHFADAHTMQQQYWRWRADDAVRQLDSLIAAPAYVTHRLTNQGFSAEAIAGQLGLAARTVVRYRGITPEEPPRLPLGHIEVMRGRGVSWTDINATIGKPFEHGYILEAVYNWLLDNQDALIKPRVEAA